MEEKVDELYQEYLFERLDKIFDVSTNDKDNREYAIVEEHGEYNFVDKTGKRISDRNFSRVWDFCNGFAKVEISLGFYNFIDTNGRLISHELYQEAKDFSPLGLALVKQEYKYNYIDKNGNPISDVWYIELDSFHDGYACAIESLNKCTYIDKNGKPISSERYSEVHSFHNGFAMVKKYNRYNYIDTSGNLISENWFYAGDNFINGLAKVRFSNKWGIIDTKGNIVGKTVNDYDELYLTEDFVRFSKNDFRCRTINLGKYDSNKTTFGYQCNAPGDTFKVKYEPIRIYGTRYVLCLDKCNLYLYERDVNLYKQIGTVYNIRFNDCFIFVDNKYYADGYFIYFMHNNEMIDISKYCEERDINIKNISIEHIKQNISIISKDDFLYHNEDEIRELVKREREEDKKREEEENKKREQEKLKELKSASEREKASMISKKKEALQQIKKSLEVLDELENKTQSYNKIQISNLFIDVSNHREINPIFLDINMLKYIDLSLVSFKNVKISGIDFRGCNISLNPQEVYNKDLSGCNFEGIHIEPFMNFSGVDIRGARFSDDKNPKTLDLGCGTFSMAIYDETTTYKGIPFTMIYGECKNGKSHTAK